MADHLFHAVDPAGVIDHALQFLLGTGDAEKVHNDFYPVMIWALW